MGAIISRCIEHMIRQQIRSRNTIKYEYLSGFLYISSFATEKKLILRQENKREETCNQSASQSENTKMTLSRTLPIVNVHTVGISPHAGQRATLSYAPRSIFQENNAWKDNRTEYLVVNKNESHAHTTNFHVIGNHPFSGVSWAKPWAKEMDHLVITYTRR